MTMLSSRTFPGEGNVHMFFFTLRLWHCGEKRKVGRPWSSLHIYMELYLSSSLKSYAEWSNKNRWRGLFPGKKPSFEKISENV